MQRNLSNVEKHITEISQEQVVNLSNFQEINIISNRETVNHIKKLSKESGLPISRVIEAMIRAALDDLKVATG
ncbi:hypothetical protein [Desulforamulus aeronauticus]|uniref:Uncharacterized protein n=1 Tax=Desulforamulus aeronauticus DSM 10349 TaxID=1121421 RepID=A0A1M6SN34_9FIRM|nr:hypothetical protein [Desulforamulus aeronauticus]SHK46060.1 hypothetical protein SAMN02745123_01914 [Desulforamulus aeronauticus DSM 10349]